MHRCLRHPFLALALLLAWLLAWQQAGAADLTVMPVTLHLDRTHDRTTVQVTNQGREPVLLQADAIAWNRVAGVDSNAPTGDLMVNPPVFTLAPGRTQIVRVGLRRAAEADSEMTYRMVLREVPMPNDAFMPTVQGQVRVLVTLLVPVYVAPNAVRREQHWRARLDAEGRLVADVTNTGNVHYKVGSVGVQGELAHPPVTAKGPESVLFPGEARSFRLPAPALPTARPITLEVMTDRGMQHVALDLPHR